MRKLFITLLLPLTALMARGEAPVVRAWFDKDSIMIGDQFQLRVEVDKDIMQAVEFPTFEKELWKGFELIGEGDVDTLKVEGRNHTIAKEYTLTNFDEGIYSLSPFPLGYYDKNINDTIWSPDSLRIRIATFEIDTLTMVPYDIKPQLKAPFSIFELKGLMLWIYGGLVLAAAIVCLIVYLRKRRIKKEAKAYIPPHVKAIRMLEELHNQKVWQNNKHKLYYTRMTDIVREYIDGRFGIPAPELTTDETMGALNSLRLNPKSLSELESLLKAADMVKFAKFIPEAQANEESYLAAYYFVEETKPAEIPGEAMEEES